MTTMTTDRKFGIEIECFGTTQELAADAILRAGVECNIERYGHSAPRAWKIVPDGSLAGVRGFEVVSPPLSGDAGLEQVRTVAKALVEAGCKVSKECGFHVHVDAAGLSKVELLNVAKRYQKFESEIDKFMPSSRRNNRYCRSMNEFFMDYYHNDRSTQALRAGTVRDMLGYFGNPEHDRYFKVNLQAYLRHGTVEFRQHSGTVNATKMVNWIVFCTNFVENSKVAVPRPAPVAVIPVGSGYPSARPVAGRRRINALQTKFELMARMFDGHGCMVTVFSYNMARELGIAEASVPAYVSMFRAKYPGIRIKARRGRGYYKVTASSLAEIVCSDASVRSTPAPVRQPAPSETLPVISLDDSWCKGLSTEIRTFYEERAMELWS